MKKIITVLITSIITLTGCTINKYGYHSNINLEEINDNIYVNYYGSIIYLEEDFNTVKSQIGEPLTIFTPQDNITMFFYKYLIIRINSITNKIEEITIHRCRSYKKYGEGIQNDNPMQINTFINVLIIDKNNNFTFRIGEKDSKVTNYFGKPTDEIVGGIYRYNTNNNNELRFDMVNKRIRDVYLSLQNDRKTLIEDR